MGAESRAVAAGVAETGSCWSHGTIVHYERRKFWDLMYSMVTS